MKRCPLCGSEGTKLLIGIFPMRICNNEECGVCWGAWSRIGIWLSDKLSPDGDGFTCLAYDCSYLRALWASLTHKESE